ncbi:hypothetical protein AMTR_s04586p00003770 [Amborella trichopoda]|uniref:Uncharacterized protein n=1 Tax=Amborella trichopoda TaxID=13333 RepID=U5CXF3_AMBTC|nr:hypothetical protein AMTR_s04586p00003770 [Amborella trichopoda]
MASNSYGTTSIPIILVPPSYGEMPFISKAEEVWFDYEPLQVPLDLVCSTLEVVNAKLTKIEDTIQCIVRDFEAVEDGLEELRSSVYRYLFGLWSLAIVLH